MSLIVTPRCLAVCLTSSRDSVAVANLRCSSTRWFMNDGGGVNGRVSSGDSFLLLLRTLFKPLAVYAITPGSRPICLMWSAIAVRTSCELLGAGSVA